jgi:YVTN family beta-propeller protein
MKKRRKVFLIFGGIIFLGIVLSFPVHKWARGHVNYMTAAQDHPLNCMACHLYVTNSPVTAALIHKEYLSPFNLAVSKDGKRLYVVAQEAGSLLVVDAVNKKVIKKIRVGRQPHSVALDKKEGKAYVSNQWSDNVSVIDLDSLKVTGKLKTANGPAGLSITHDGRFLFVVNSFSSDISVIDLETGEEVSRLSAGNNPTGIQISPNGGTMYVTSRRAIIAPYGEPVYTELTCVNAESRRVTEHKNIQSAYMMENAAFTPSGDLAIVTLIRPKNNIPTLQVDRGWMMTEGIGVIEQAPDGRTIQLLLDEPNAYYADPFDIVITPDGKKGFVSNSGVNCISVFSIDSIRSILRSTTPEMTEQTANYLGMSGRFVIKRIPTGADPKGMALSSDGSTLYVAEQLEDRIAVINADNMETLYTIDLGGPKRISELRKGRRLFNNAGRTFQTQYSCYTCHPDAHEDGLIYNMASKDMGRNITNTMSLRNVGDTPPYKWTGKNQSVYKQDGMRFSTVLTRTEAFPYEDLDAIVAYIMRGIPNPPNLQYNPTGELTESQLRGKLVFERTKDTYGNEIPVASRCITCHPAPYYTNKKMAYIATLATSDDSTLFDTPGLFNLFASAPYLHDGRAVTLEEIWTKYGQTERHGIINDLSKNQLNDMVDYLKSLRDPLYDQKTKKEHITQTEHN